MTTTAKHTPGPWAVEVHEWGIHRITHSPEGWAQTWEIAEVANQTQEGMVEANAHLIAATLDLLEAAKKAHHFLFDELIKPIPGQASLKEFDNCVLQLQAAIAKAEGRE